MLGGDAAVYRGREGLRELVRDLDETLPVTFRSRSRRCGTSVISSSQSAIFGAAARKAGPRSSRRSVTCLTSEKARWLQLSTYLDPAEALEAAGLSE